MKIIEIKKENNQAFVTGLTDAVLYNQYYNQLAKMACKDIKVNGFRKGHVPFEVAQKFLNFEKISEEAFKELMNFTISHLHENKELDQHEVLEHCIETEILDLNHQTKEITFTATFETKPSITLGDFSDIKTIFSLQDPDTKFWLKTKKESIIGPKDCVVLSILAKNKDGKSVFKFSADIIEIDLETTKVPKEIIQEIMTAKLTITKVVSIKLKEEKEELTFFITVKEIRDKHPIDEALLKELNDKQITSVEQLKFAIKENITIHNKQIQARFINQWGASDANTLSYVPEKFLKIETERTFKAFMHSNRSLAKNEQIAESIFKNMFFENLNKLKMACILEEIAKQEKITCTQEEQDKLMEYLKSTEDTRENIEPKRMMLKHPELVVVYLLQEKAFAFLQDKIIFSK